MSDVDGPLLHSRWCVRPPFVRTSYVRPQGSEKCLCRCAFSLITLMASSSVARFALHSKAN